MQFFLTVFWLLSGKSVPLQALMFANLITSMPLYVCTFWSVLLLVDVAVNRQPARKRLLAYMLTATLLYAGHYIFFNRLTALLPFTDTVYLTTNLAVFPLYYLYILEITEPVWDRRLQWLLPAPAVLMGATAGTLYALMSPTATATFVDTYLYHNQLAGLDGLAWWQGVVHHVAKLLFALQIPAVLVMGQRKIKGYNERVEACYADTDTRRLHLLTTILTLFLVAAFLSFSANVLGRHRFSDSLWLLAVPSVLFSVLQFMLGYAGYHQQFTIADLQRDMEPTEQEADDCPADEQLTQAPGGVATEQTQAQSMAILQEQLFSTIVNEQLYLQPNLKITELATRMNSNRTYVARAFKQAMGCTFSEFINRQRIDYACRLMAEQPDIPIGTVATASGYASPASFYRNFKLYKQCSPTDYHPAP